MIWIGLVVGCAVSSFADADDTPPEEVVEEQPPIEEEDPWDLLLEQVENLPPQMEQPPVELPPVEELPPPEEVVEND